MLQSAEFQSHNDKVFDNLLPKASKIIQTCYNYIVANWGERSGYSRSRLYVGLLNEDYGVVGNDAWYGTIDTKRRKTTPYGSLEGVPVQKPPTAIATGWLEAKQEILSDIMKYTGDDEEPESWAYGKKSIDDYWYFYFPYGINEEDKEMWYPLELMLYGGGMA